jgi:acetylornithine deacetylase
VSIDSDPVDLLAALVAIDSINPGLVPGASGETAIVATLHDRLERSGFTTRVLTPDGHPDRPSLLAWHQGARPGPTVLFNGHLDTVGVDQMAAPFQPRIEGHRLYGRGAADMKGGIAGLVVAAEQIARGDVGGMILALVADEEDASLGTETVLAQLEQTGMRPYLALVGEPTLLDLTISLRGFALFEVELTGRAAHSSTPAEGVNAVTHLGRLLAAVEQADNNLQGGGSLLATVAAGGQAPFSLAASAFATIERRTVPGETVGQAVSEIDQILDALRTTDPAFTGTARLAVGRDAWKLDETGRAASFATLLDEALRDAPGRTGTPFAAPYWMEAPLFAAAGIPAVVCGPSGGGLHAVDEWVDLRQVRAYATGLVTAFTEYAAAGAHAH